MKNLNTTKRNYIIFFFTFFATNVVFIYVNVYLPVYFFNVLNINRVELAFVQLFAYLAWFAQPLIAIYFDKERSNMRFLVVISAIGMVVSFFLFILNLSLLIVFGIFLAIYFVCTSIMLVAINKIFVSYSLDDKTKGRNSVYILMGGITGALLPNVVAIMLFGDFYSLTIWNMFFLIGVISVFPVIIISLMVRFDMTNVEETGMVDEIEKIEEVQIDKRGIILLSIIYFLIFVEYIYQYPMEPWLLDKFGVENFTFILILFGIVILLNATGIVLGGVFSNKLEKTKVLFMASLIYGILLLIAPFTGLILFFTLFGIMNVCSGLIIVNITILMNEYSQKKVVYYQTIFIFGVLSVVIFVPTGTYLSAFIATEIIIIIAGISKLICLIPILFLARKRKE